MIRVRKYRISIVLPPQQVALIGVIAISAALTGYFTSKMNMIERGLFFAGGLMLLTTNRYLNIGSLI